MQNCVARNISLICAGRIENGTAACDSEGIFLRTAATQAASTVKVQPTADQDVIIRQAAGLARELALFKAPVRTQEARAPRPDVPHETSPAPAAQPLSSQQPVSTSSFMGSQPLGPSFEHAHHVGSDGDVFRSAGDAGLGASNQRPDPYFPAASIPGGLTPSQHFNAGPHAWQQPSLQCLSPFEHSGLGRLQALGSDPVGSPPAGQGDLQWPQRIEELRAEASRQYGELSTTEMLDVYERQQQELVALSRQLEDVTRRNIELSTANLQQLQTLQSSNAPIVTDIAAQPPRLSQVATKVRAAAAPPAPPPRPPSQARALNAAGAGQSSSHGGGSAEEPRAERRSRRVAERQASYSWGGSPEATGAGQSPTGGSVSRESSLRGGADGVFSQEEAANILLHMQSRMAAGSPRQ